MIFERTQEWAKARDWILPAMEHGHGTHTEDDILVRILNGEYKLWLFEKSAVVTNFIQYPQFKAFNIAMAGGDMEDLKTHQCEMERWAAAQGCKQICSGGRDGWGRVFPEYKRLALYYKDL